MASGRVPKMMRFFFFKSIFFEGLFIQLNLRRIFCKYTEISNTLGNKKSQLYADFFKGLVFANEPGVV